MRDLKVHMPVVRPHRDKFSKGACCTTCQIKTAFLFCKPADIATVFLLKSSWCLTLFRFPPTPPWWPGKRSGKPSTPVEHNRQAAVQVRRPEPL